MKQNLTKIGQELTNLINRKLQEPLLSKEDYINVLSLLGVIVDIELKTITNQIIDIIEQGEKKDGI